MSATNHLQATTLKAPFAWVGGKSKLAKEIIALMPEHKRYVEVFGGGLSVLYAKPKISNTNRYIEVVNDINSHLINLHTIIKTRPQSFALELNNILYSREIFENIKSGRLRPRNNIQKAAFYYCLIVMSFGGQGDYFAMSKRRAPKNLYKSFERFSLRLKGVCIENMSFERLIKEYDGEDCLFYLDPPYVGSEDYYKHTLDFGENEHIKLCEILKGIKGKFILSYNDCELIRELYRDFTITQTQEIRYTLNIKSAKRTREVLVRNC